MLEVGVLGSTDYRYGYQGSEKELQATTGGAYSTEYRMLDTRIGRWFSPDPIEQPWQAPYTSMDNNPVALNDVLGLKAGDPPKGNHNTDSSPLEGYAYKEPDDCGNVDTKKERFFGSLKKVINFIGQLVISLHKNGSEQMMHASEMLYDKDDRRVARRKKIERKFKEEFEDWRNTQNLNTGLRYYVKDFIDALESRRFAPVYYKRYRYYFGNSSVTGAELYPRRPIRISGGNGGVGRPIVRTLNVPFSGTIDIGINASSASSPSGNNVTILITDVTGSTVFTQTYTGLTGTSNWDRNLSYNNSNPGRITVTITSTDVATGVITTVGYGMTFRASPTRESEARTFKRRNPQHKGIFKVRK